MRFSLIFLQTSIFDSFVRVSLIVPLVFHAQWNLGSEGLVWWSEHSGLPLQMRYVIGLAEYAAALSFISGVFLRLAALGLCLIFAGAVYQHLPMGFSFKENGWESPFVYLMLSIAYVFKTRR